ncbi:MAG: hypothetical protein ACOX54_09795 [Christensenellales bacterium]|jgi:hypothetical protein
MKLTKELELGTFVYENEKVNGANVQSFLGIPYASAERFGMLKMISIYKKQLVKSGVRMISLSLNYNTNQRPNKRKYEL